MPFESILLHQKFIFKDQERKQRGGCGGAPETRHYGAHRQRLRRSPEVRIGARAQCAYPDNCRAIKFDFSCLSCFTHLSLSFSIRCIGTPTKFLKFIVVQ